MKKSVFLIIASLPSFKNFSCSQKKKSIYSIFVDVIFTTGLIFTPFLDYGQDLKKYKGNFPDPNKTQIGIATYDYLEDSETHERIKNGLFVYDFKGVGDYKGFNQNISGIFKDGKREGVWTFSITMNDFGVKNPYYTGVLKAKTSYLNGKPEGMWTYNYTYKKRNQVYSYGTLKWGEFSEDLKTEVSCSFKEGQFCGPVKIIDNIKGNTIEGTFASNGMLDGKWTIVDNLKGTTKVIEYRNSILIDSYTRNSTGEIIQRISSEDKKRFEEIYEIRQMSEEQRIDDGVSIDTVNSSYLNDYLFWYSRNFFEPVYFMPTTIGGEFGFSTATKEIVIVRERRTPLSKLYDYNDAIGYVQLGKFNMAFYLLHKIVNDANVYNTLSKTDKNLVEDLSKKCKDSITETIKLSLKNTSYLNALRSSLNNYGQNILYSGLWKTSTYNGNWFNRDRKELWSQLRGNYPIWIQLITDNYLNMKEAVDVDTKKKEIVKFNFDENGIYNTYNYYTYDIRDSSSFISKSLLKDYYKSIELFSLSTDIDSLRRDVDSLIDSYDDKSITKAFQRIKEYYNSMLANINTIDLLMSKFNFERTSYESIYKYLKSSDKDSLKVILKKSDDIPNFIDAMKN